ncbi:TPA: viroplasmin family protein [Streptococcus agalactiae]|nr:RNase H1/viroplasmin domain-containing protein [Streptococcus agalactiae]HEO2267412.1 RNase H1/viroplasmin domain-containing protein [Streptococcus agalactiae]HEO7770338.1 RNase H1/viroplasmin domain-containing protein [Streptococcus agalactiae]
MAKKPKYYAVKKGRQIGVFLTWEECKEQVDHYKEPLYKSFNTVEEAESYIGGGYKYQGAKHPKQKP